jgi:hypothetical protein
METMSTPESAVKNKVKRLLDQYKPMYTHWPVPYGMGEPTLDCIACLQGFFFAIETKAPGKKPTPRQEVIITRIQAAGGRVFVIDGDAGIENLRAWLKMVVALA